MKIQRASLTGGILVLILHVFSASVRRGLFSLLGEQLVSNIVFAVTVAAVVSALVWSVLRQHRDLLPLALACGTILYILTSSPVFDGRFSFFLFFLLGALSVVDERKTSKWGPILLIIACALLCEWLPGILFASVRFYWLDVLRMVVGGFSGRMVVSSNK